MSHVTESSYGETALFVFIIVRVGDRRIHPARSAVSQTNVNIRTFLIEVLNSERPIECTRIREVDQDRSFLYSEGLSLKVALVLLCRWVK